MLVDSRQAKSSRIRKEIQKVNAGVDRYHGMLVKETYNSEEPPEFMSDVADTGEEAFMENARNTAFKMSELRQARQYLENKTGIYSLIAEDLIRKIDHAELRVAEAGTELNENDYRSDFFLPSEEYSLGCIYRDMTEFSDEPITDLLDNE